MDKATGDIYDDELDYIDIRGKELSAAAILCKNGSKLTGLKPLKGTTRQIEWAEKIRFEKIKSMTDSQLSIVKLGNASTYKAQFWINNRYADNNDIIDSIEHFYSKKGKKMILRGYQQELFDLVTPATTNDLIQLDTGAGKTPIEAALCGWAEYSIIVAHRNILISQCSEKLAAFGIMHDTISTEHTRRRCMLAHKKTWEKFHIAR
ncbi:hypothetical protein C6H68_23915 [Photorhabdus luminescens]|nr:hypothetical protein C6H68_23915 [Photorhabdus luminescens]